MTDYTQHQNIINNSTRVDPNALDSDQLKIYLENQDRKSDSQRRMAWIALFSVIVLLIFLLFPVIPIERLDALIGIITTFIISMVSIVGFFFGSQAWMSRPINR